MVTSGFDATQAHEFRFISHCVIPAECCVFLEHRGRGGVRISPLLSAGYQRF